MLRLAHTHHHTPSKHTQTDRHNSSLPSTMISHTLRTAAITIRSSSHTTAAATGHRHVFYSRTAVWVRKPRYRFLFWSKTSARVQKPAAGPPVHNVHFCGGSFCATAVTILLLSSFSDHYCLSSCFQNRCTITKCAEQPPFRDI